MNVIGGVTGDKVSLLRWWNFMLKHSFSCLHMIGEEWLEVQGSTLQQWQNYLHFQAIPETSLGYLHFCMLQAIKNWCQERSRNTKLSGTMHNLFSSIKNTCISSLFFWLQFCNQNWKPWARAGLEVAVWGATYSIQHAYACPTVLCILPSTNDIFIHTDAHKNLLGVEKSCICRFLSFQVVIFQVYAHAQNWIPERNVHADWEFCEHRDAGVLHKSLRIM